MFKLSRLRVQIASTNISRRCNSTAKNPTRRTIAGLDERGLIRVSGSESSSFLQGLITNDMRHLDEGAGSMYAMFLNTKGRVLYDVILYRTKEREVFLIECDVRVSNALQKHLKLYRVRRKIDVDDIGGETKVWSIFGSENEEKNADVRVDDEARIFSTSGDSAERIKNIGVYKDPRFAGLGLRVLTDRSIASNELVDSVDPRAAESKDPQSYRSLIYKFGVGEGCDDLPPGKALPLESNCDYLHGVSFHKGCYIGQELTARTHHTGVVRKRLMPLRLESGDGPSEALNGDETVTNEADKVVGKLKGRVEENGLGLMRIAETLAARTLKVSGGMRGTAFKPVWWPQETSKERISTLKNE